MGYASETIATFGQAGTKPGLLYMNVYAKMFKHYFPDGYVNHEAFWGKIYNVLSPGERAILMANELFGELHINGLYGYLDNGNYAHAHEMVRLLRRVGDNRAADFLQKAVEIAGIPDPLPADYVFPPTEETDVREDSEDAEEGMGVLYEALKKHHDANRGSDFQSSPLGNMEAALDKYILAHPEEFGETPNK